MARAHYERGGRDVLRDGKGWAKLEDAEIRYRPKLEFCGALRLCGRLRKRETREEREEMLYKLRTCLDMSVRGLERRKRGRNEKGGTK